MRPGLLVRRIVASAPQGIRTGIKQGITRLWQWGLISFETGTCWIHWLGVELD